MRFPRHPGRSQPAVTPFRQRAETTVAEEKSKDPNGRQRSERKKDPPPPPPPVATGFFASLFRPWTKHRVTLTRPGKKAAPLRKGKAPSAKGPAPKAGGREASPATGPGKKPRSERHERQVRELKTLANIGRRNPERLAAIISRLLHEAQELEEDQKLKFERLVWEKAESAAQRRKSESGERRAEQPKADADGQSGKPARGQQKPDERGRWKPEGGRGGPTGDGKR